MKKLFITLTILLGMVLSFSSCASQMERDAEKMAKRSIEMERVIKRMEDHSNLGGKRMTEQEYQEYASDYIRFANELNAKYSETREMHEEFYKLVKKKKEELKK